jgi:hypothetical protein
MSESIALDNCVNCGALIGLDRGSNSLCGQCFKTIDEGLRSRIPRIVTMELRCGHCRAKLGEFQATSSMPEEECETTTICPSCQVILYGEEVALQIKARRVA